jgi:hypothetical protein
MNRGETPMADAEIPRWALSKEEQKRELECALRGWLDSAKDNLAPHQRFFLAEAIGLTLRGRFAEARQALFDAYQGAEQFVHYAMDSEIIAKASLSNLRRAFHYVENTAAQDYPVFC